MLIFRLFWEFFKTGLFAIGGGLATLPFLYDMQAATGWFTLDDISNMIAISESTPGPMGINMATYTGFTSMGVLGGIAAVAGLVTPSIIIIIIVSNILEKFKTNKYVQYCMYGLRAASVGLISVAGLRVAEAAFLRSQPPGASDEPEHSDAEHLMNHHASIRNLRCIRRQYLADWIAFVFLNTL